ncbi:unnamed protein product [Cuscuta europaea]|uniref:FAF domain-containing protein n=1 Tax=Cuscuta europaea TaxID=41803 RepID=A0A9P0YYY6_CUSEU|nr:unnamed protein product [Cuscuta europaea]
MSTIVYHHHRQHERNNNSNSNNPQSCYETASMRLRVPSSLSPCLNVQEDDDGWSSIQTLSSNAIASRVRRHKSPCRRMSEKSLAMCTEILGSETGVDFIDNDLLSSLISSHTPLSMQQDDKLIKKSSNMKKRNSRNNNFPPPLSTIRGATSLHLTSRREGGKLEIMAAEVPSRNSFREVDSSNGRLKLFYFSDNETNMEGSENEEIQGKNIIEEDGEENELGVDVEKGIEKCLGGSGCKEGGHGNEGRSSHWEKALLVAI